MCVFRSSDLGIISVMILSQLTRYNYVINRESGFAMLIVYKLAVGKKCQACGRSWLFIKFHQFWLTSNEHNILVLRNRVMGKQISRI